MAKVKMWTEQDLVNVLSEEWERSHTDLEAATIKSVAEQFGVWEHLAAALEEGGWDTDGIF